ncbi:hypothetical protein RB653_000501 [Dictyostelium firmibasis]|uniref:Methyltransferase type 11 domain-containing protein n=1 Tax=Dictyostelium firmibasis TaxID=79012 RepID=A0AAN7U613_9MYCE
MMEDKSQLLIIGTGIIFAVVSYILIDYFGKKLHFKQRFFKNFWGYLLGPIIEKSLKSTKEKLYSEANGKVLEIGSGIGSTFKYLNFEKITTLVSIEPNPFMFYELEKESLKYVRVGKKGGKEGLYNDHDQLNLNSDSKRIKIISKSIEKSINDKDIEYLTFDTVICNLVLCSIKDEREMLEKIKRLLKPGGKFLFIEHIASEKKHWKIFQHLINPFWSLIGDNCKLTKKTDTEIKSMKGWEKVSISQFVTTLPLTFIHGIAIKEL